MASGSVGFRIAVLACVAASAWPADSPGTWEGRVEVIAEDDFEKGAGRTRTWLETGGERIELVLAPGSPVPEPGRRLTVRGARSGNRITPSSMAFAPAAEPAPSCSNPLGEQRVAVLLLEFPNARLSATGLAPEQYRDAFFSATDPSLGGYLREASYGKAWVSGGTFGPFLLDRDYKYPDEIWEGYGAAIRAADGTVDFRNFDRIYLVWPGVSGIGASGSVGCASLNSPTKGILPVSESILAIGTGQPYEAVVSFAIHEAGHNLGLNHAAALDFGDVPLGVPGAAGKVVEYGDPFSQMGSGRTPAVPPQWVFGHFPAPHKFRLGWLEAPDGVREVTSAGTFRLQAFESSGAGPKALRIRRGPDSDKWLWVEYRQPLGYDRTLARQGGRPFSGALVHYEDPALEDPVNPLAQGRSYLLDFTASSTPGDFSDAALESGQSWTDPFTPLTVLVSGAGGSGLDVTVLSTAPCATLSATQQDHGWGAGTGSVNVSAPPECSWTVSSNADWISVTSGPSGSGSGTVSYAIAPHSEPGLRTGTLFIGSQTFTVTQASSWISPLPALARLTPRSGAGFGGTFTFVFSDPVNAVDLRYVQMFFRGRDDNRQCWVTVAPQSPAMVILKSAENPFLDAMSTLLGNGGFLQNGVCAVDVGGIKITSSGWYVTVVLPVVFTAGLSGPLRVWARADGQEGAASDSSATPGTWTVPDGACRGTLGSGYMFGAGETKSSVTLAIDAGCPWVATSHSDWISISSGARGEGSGTVGYTVSANAGDYPRVGWITVAGQTMVMGQSGRGRGAGPMLASNGVLNGASLKPETGITSASWVSVNGLNLADTTRSVLPSDLTGGRLPTQLEGVSVTVNGKSAFLRRVSPMQIDALAPEDDAEGRVAVEVTNRQGRSNGVMVSKQKFAPAFYTTEAGGRRYAAAARTDGVPVGSPESEAVRPGETILIQGTGFGPVNPAGAAGEAAPQPAPAVYPPQIRIGNLAAGVLSAALVSPGVFQFAVLVPEVGDGDQPVVGEIGLSITPGSVYLRVKR